MPTPMVIAARTEEANMRVGMPVTAPTTAMIMTANMTAIMATAKVRRLASVCVPVVAWVAAAVVSTVWVGRSVMVAVM